VLKRLGNPFQSLVELSYYLLPLPLKGKKGAQLVHKWQMTVRSKQVDMYLIKNIFANSL
jgi:hypothetical protein